MYEIVSTAYASVAVTPVMVISYMAVEKPSDMRSSGPMMSSLIQVLALLGFMKKNVRSVLSVRLVKSMPPELRCTTHLSPGLMLGVIAMVYKAVVYHSIDNGA